MTERVSAWQDPWNRLLHKANRLEIELAASENAREAVERQRDLLLAALGAVEWMTVPGIGHICPWCSAGEFMSHAPDCQRQAAIALAAVTGNE